MATEAPASTTPAASTASPAAAATTEAASTTTPSNQSSDPAASTTQQQQATTEQPGADDLLFSEQKPDDKAKAEAKPPVADQKKYLEGKVDPKTLEGKTDEEIAKLYDEEKAKETPTEAKVDFTKLTLPEGQTISEANQAALQSFITKHKLPPEAAQEAAQELANMGAELQKENLDKWQGLKKEWRTAVENDPILGGKNLKQTISDSNAVVRKFAGDEGQLKEFQQDLIFLGLGNKPSFVRFLANIHAATKEDTLNGQSSSTTAPTKTPAQRMYPNMKSEADAS